MKTKVGVVIILLRLCTYMNVFKDAKFGCLVSCFFCCYIRYFGTSCLSLFWLLHTNIWLFNGTCRLIWYFTSTNIWLYPDTSTNPTDHLFLSFAQSASQRFKLLLLLTYNVCVQVYLAIFKLRPTYMLRVLWSFTNKILSLSKTVTKFFVSGI